MFSSVVSARVSTPVTRPSCMTATRSETLMTYSMSEEIMMMATPDSASFLINS